MKIGLFSGFLLFTLVGCGSRGNGPSTEPSTTPVISNLVLNLKSTSGCGLLSFSTCSRTYAGTVDFTDSDGDLSVLSVDENDTTITGLDGVTRGQLPVSIGVSTGLNPAGTRSFRIIRIKVTDKQGQESNTIEWTVETT